MKRSDITSRKLENIAGRRMFFGVEIETYGAERSTVKSIVQSALRAAGFSEKRIAEWKIISDGSISSSAGSAEIASGKLGWNDKDLTALERVCNDLRAYGIRSDANHMPKSRIGIVDLDKEWRFSMSPFDTRPAIYRKARSSSYLSDYAANPRGRF